MNGIAAGALTALTAVGLVAGEAHAQIPLRLSAGPTFATISSDDWETSITTRFFAAVGTRLAVGDQLAVVPSLAYVQKGTEFDDGTKGSYDYIQIPVLLSLTVPVGATTSLEFGAGPQVGLQVTCDEDGFDCSDYDNHEGTEFGLVGMAAVNFPITDRSTLSVGGGVDYGLSTLFDELEYHTRTYSLSVSWSIRVR